jgi:acyl transferase domain-containing protein/acyl carrier protein
MLEFIQRLSHAYVAIPVLEALCKAMARADHKVQEPFCAEDLITSCKGNPGPISIALRILESAGWVIPNKDAIPRYALSPVALDMQPALAAAADLYSIDFDRFLEFSEGEPTVRNYRQLANSKSPTMDPSWREGPWLLPTLVRLFQKNPDPQFMWEGVHPDVRKLIEDALETMGLLTAGKLNDTGEAVYRRAMNAAVLSSYQSLFAQLTTLFFGAPEVLFARHEDGSEKHVNRDLNVRGSGFQHGKFFDEALDLVSKLFQSASPPQYIADMGCGDGAWLRLVDEFLSQQGKKAGLIGVDYNQASLIATAETLTGRDPILLKGDIGDPKQLRTDLIENGIDPDSVLHIRSFLDHDRPFKLPESSEIVASHPTSIAECTYLDKSGEPLAGTAVRQSLVEHLRKWANYAGERGLLILEVHSLPPHIAHQYADETESIHFDAYHAFSRQYLVEAAEWLLACVEAGLFPTWDNFRRFPRSLPYSRITLGHYVPKPYHIRLAREEDLPRLVEIESLCWPEESRTPEAIIRQRIQQNPSGQFILEDASGIGGVLYTQRVKDPKSLNSSQAATIDSLHTPEGDWVQFISLNLHPDYQGRALSDELLEFGLVYAELFPNTSGVCGVTRCLTYPKSGASNYDEFISARSETGLPKDPVLAFHYGHGATIGQPVPGYRPQDTINQGNGVFLHYDFATRRRQRYQSHTPHPEKSATGLSQDSVYAIIRDAMGTKGNQFDPQCPLLEMGLDSMDIMELRVQLGHLIRRPLQSNFFFSHPTPQHIAEALPLLAETNTQKSNAVGPNIQDTPLAQFTGPSEKQETAVIIGMACRFPGAVTNPEELWELLCEGRDAITAPDPSRTHLDISPSHAQRHGGYLHAIDQFDADFFRMAPAEAEQTDPQHRLLLQETWHALEHANMDPTTLKRSKTGVFIGQFSHDYEHLALNAETDVYFGTGNSASITAGRIAYFYGLEGPALTVDTACSSSLTALHLARQSLASGECDLAIVGAVNLILSGPLSEAFNQAGMLAPDGKCKTFDASADGYVRGEGCAVIILQREADAQRAGNTLHARILTTQLNQDGASNGLTAPNPIAQERLLNDALEASALRPDDIQLIEAHGTGTSLGDPIEFGAIQATYGKSRKSPLFIGSIKSNIGHTEATAGFAGLFKAVLCLKNAAIPPSLHFNNANPQIALKSARATVPTSLTPWPEETRLNRRAAVSSFGFSGTNAHVILEAAEDPIPSDDQPTGPLVLTLSAKHQNGLEALRKAYEKLLSRPDVDPRAVAQTSNLGRSALPMRIAVTGSDPESLGQALATAAVQRSSTAPSHAWLFTGQGSQYHGMGETLFAQCPEFREHLKRAIKAVNAHVEEDFEAVYFGGIGDERIHQTAYTQPALFAFQYALGSTLKNWGLEPHYAVGHSVGEYAAACLFGVFCLEDAARLICARGRLMQSLPQSGSMLALQTRPETASRLLYDQPSVALGAVNAEQSVVLSGDTAALQKIKIIAEKENIRSKFLKVSHAFHSPLMDPILEEFAAVTQSIAYSLPDRPIFPTARPDGTSEDLAQPEYWVDHIRATVAFAPALKTLLKKQPRFCLEIGPRPILTGLAQQDHDESVTEFISAVESYGTEWESLSDVLSKLWQANAEINWKAVHRGHAVSRAQLPVYPFLGQSYWLPRTTGTKNVQLASNQLTSSSPLLASRVSQTDLSLQLYPYLADHIIQEIPIVPAAAMLAHWTEAMRSWDSHKKIQSVGSVLFAQALALNHHQIRRAQFVQPDKKDAEFQFISFQTDTPDNYLQHASGRFLEDFSEAAVPDLAALRNSLKRISGQEVDAEMRRRGFALGPSFLWIQELWVGENEALCRMEQPAGLDHATDFILHPTLIDSSFQPFFYLLPDKDNQTWVPFRLDKFRVFTGSDTTTLNQSLWCHVVLKEDIQGTQKIYSIDSVIFDEGGDVRAITESLQFRPVPVSAMQNLRLNIDGLLHQIQWDPVHLEGYGDANPNPAFLTLSESAVDLWEQSFVPSSTDSETNNEWVLLHLPDCSLVPTEVHKALKELFRYLKQLLQSSSDSHSVLLLTRHTDSNADPFPGMAMALCRSLLLEQDNFKISLLRSASKALPPIGELFTVTHESPGQQLLWDGNELLAERWAPRNTAPPTIRAIENKGPILITGGKSGLGLLSARAFAEAGYNNLILASRGEANPESTELINELQQNGIAVRTVSLDVANASAVLELFKSEAQTGQPIQGVVHAAGTLHDGLFSNLQEDTFFEPFSAKVQGAWNLHTASMDHPDLEFFILFGSITSYTGSHGQTNYAAANAYMDALAESRKIAGLPGIYVAWGPWDAGMAARLGDSEKTVWKERGLNFIESAAGAALIPLLGGFPEIRLGAAKIEKEAFQRNFPFLDVPAIRSQAEASISKGASLLESWSELDSVQRAEAVASFLQSTLKSVMRLREPLEPRARFFDHGMDSITAVRLRNQLNDGLGHKLPATVVFDYPTVEALQTFILEQVARLEAPHTEPKTNSTVNIPAHQPEEKSQSEKHIQGLDEMTSDDLLQAIADRADSLEKLITQLGH